MAPWRRGRVAIAGVAWAPDRGISKVEVGIDGDVVRGGPVDARSPTRPGSSGVAWDATPGQHRLSVRATDGEGVLQEELRSPPAPNGARGWHTIVVRVD